MNSYCKLTILRSSARIDQFWWIRIKDLSFWLARHDLINLYEIVLKTDHFDKLGTNWSMWINSCRKWIRLRSSTRIDKLLDKISRPFFLWPLCKNWRIFRCVRIGQLFVNLRPGQLFNTNAVLVLVLIPVLVRVLVLTTSTSTSLGIDNC